LPGLFVFLECDMRDDMYKVIVERPRHGRAWQDDGRVFRNSEDRPARIGMRNGYFRRKSLNENLAPLERWLWQQRHRPWDKVYSELSAGIDRRNTVQDHIYTHLDDFVEREARLVDGKVYARNGWRRGVWAPVEETRVKLFVHPTTGILLPNRGAERAARNQREADAAKRRDRPYAVYHTIDASTQWHQREGCWFEVRLEHLPQAPAGARVAPMRYDVLRRCEVSLANAYQGPGGGTPSNYAMYGRADLYATSKRQLSRREVAQRLG